MSEDNKLYSENMIYIEDIVDSMRKNSFTFFCGSGATADATGATWTDLFKKELEVIDKEESDCYRLAQYYEQHFGREKLINHIFFQGKMNQNILMRYYNCQYTNFGQQIMIK